MGDFYLLCAWDNYYPDSGLGNIKMCANTEEELADLKAELEDEWDNVRVYHSSWLPS